MCELYFYFKTKITMADSATIVDVAAPVTGASPASKKSKISSAASKKPRVKAHPPTAEMVNSAITSLKERGGSSLQAIKKYLTSTYKIDADKLAPFIKKYLRSAVTDGQLIQTKGKGASGSFKLPAAKRAAVVKKTKTAEKKPKAKKVVLTVAAKKKSILSTKKVAGTKKSVEKKKAAVTTAKTAKKLTSVKAAKSPKQKLNKLTKAIVKKPKTLKLKKVSPTKKSSTATKKVAAPKKK